MAEDTKVLAARLVAAYVRNNPVAVGDVAGLITSTYAALVGAASAPAGPVEIQQPAAPVKKSVTPDHLVCLECGKHQKMLKRHLATSHGLSAEEYRAKWSLASDYPMAAPNYAEKRSQMAIKIGLGRKPKAAAGASGDDAAGARTAQHRYPASRWSKPTV